MKLFALWVGSLAVSATWGQQVLRSSITMEPRSVSPARAALAANRFATALGLHADFRRGTAVYDRDYGHLPGKAWNLTDAGYEVTVAAHSCQVLSLTNEARIDDQNHRRRRTGKPLFTNRVRAKAYIEKLVARIGTPKGCVMKFSYNLEGTIKDQNASGQFGAVYFRNKRPVMTISCDIQDGVPVSITIG